MGYGHKTPEFKYDIHNKYFTTLQKKKKKKIIKKATTKKLRKVRLKAISNERNSILAVNKCEKEKKGKKVACKSDIYIPWNSSSHSKMMKKGKLHLSRKDHETMEKWNILI